MATIVIKLKGGIISEVNLEKDTTIGRDMSGDVYLKHPSVSRKHTRILKKGPTFYVEDLNSTNGTFVNGEIISRKIVLSDGDEIGIGNYTVLFKTDYMAKTGRHVKLAPDFMDSTMKMTRKLKKDSGE